MKTKIEIKTFLGKLLFEFEKENNTVKDTLIEAASRGADLQGAYLQGAYLRNAYLRNAYLRGADLRGADLQGAYLQGADLQGAYLQGADLQGAYLQGAYLQGAYLQGAYLQGADLQGADLRGANLQGADLQGADLQGAYLRGADLRNADLRNADLRNADLRNADLQGIKGKTLKDIKSFLWIIPEEGTFIAWKKCKNALVKISIPKEAKRTCNLKNRKCRAEFVDVLQITDLTTKKKVKTANGCYDGTIYKVGERTTADSFDPDFTVDCSHGIHFFITKQEALDFNY